MWGFKKKIDGRILAIIWDRPIRKGEYSRAVRLKAKKRGVDKGVEIETGQNKSPGAGAEKEGNFTH